MVIGGGAYNTYSTYNTYYNNTTKKECLERHSFINICSAKNLAGGRKFQGLRSVRNRSILDGCEYFKHELNEEITPSDEF